MRVGDIVINPYVSKNFDGKPNPFYASMIIHIGTEYTTTLRYDSKTSKYRTKDVKNWKIVKNVNIYEMIYCTAYSSKADKDD